MVKVKDEEKILKAGREKQLVTYKGSPPRLSADFSVEALQATKEWHDIFKVLKGRNFRPRILGPGRLSFSTEGEIKSFPDQKS